MRLIDADALKYELFADNYNAKMTSQEVADCIDNSPAIDAVPVVRCGEWVLQGENEHDYETSLEEKCSLCGRYVYRYDEQPQDNYCPNCGARMDGEV